MTTFKSLMELDIDRIATDWPSTLTYSGVAVSGTVSPCDNSDTLDADGMIVKVGAEFVAKKSLFQSVPPARSVVDIDGKKYSVISVVDDEACLTIRLERQEDKTYTHGVVG